MECYIIRSKKLKHIKIFIKKAGKIPAYIGLKYTNIILSLWSFNSLYFIPHCVNML